MPDKTKDVGEINRIGRSQEEEGQQGGNHNKMKCLPGILLFLLANDNTASGSESFDHGIVEWLNSFEGGYFNPKQEIRRENPDDPNSIVGIFAKEAIEENELLSQIPWDALISADGAEEDGDDEDGSLHCGTVRNTAREMKLGEKSKYAPYVSHLLSQREGQIPSAWSEAGKALLVDILGGEGDSQTLPPQDPFSWLDEDWYESCHGDVNDSVAAQAAMLVVSRADDDLMVPVYDMYNHRNGEWYNTKTSTIEEKHSQVRARRTIEAGEQLYNSYNFCDECDLRSDNYGTPGK
jgi:hypothetical protein